MGEPVSDDGTAGEHVLDAPAWWSIVSADGGLVRRLGGAGRYRPEVSIFGGYEPGTGGVELETLLDDGEHVALVGQDVPDGLSVQWAGEAHQMVLPGAADLGDIAAGITIAELGAADVGAMLELVEHTRPGPFGPATIRLGTYLGIRDGGRLVAMAGQRFRPDGYAEISAVCTHPDARRRGLASVLVGAQAAMIRAEGRVPFLHVATSNVSAVPVYLNLGFEERRRVMISSVGRRV